MKAPIVLVMFAVLGFTACQNKATTTAPTVEQTPTPDVKKTEATVPAPTPTPEPPAEAPKEEIKEVPAPEKKGLRTGSHGLTLQWIGWEQPGSVNISDAGQGQYRVVGQQKSKTTTDFLKLDGTLKPISEKELQFEGSIISQVSYINGGKPCERTGKQTFKASGTRKYWRLQNMLNCEGNSVTDYVDIYF